MKNTLKISGVVTMLCLGAASVHDGRPHLQPDRYRERKLEQRRRSHEFELSNRLFVELLNEQADYFEFVDLTPPRAKRLPAPTC